MDVGAELVAGDQPLESIQLLLPFRVEGGKWPGGSTALAADLYDSVVNRDTAELIFGGPVSISADAGETIVRIGDYPEPLRVLRVATPKIKQTDHHDRQDSSLVRVPLQTPLKPGERGYFRLRWRVFGAFPLWRWKRLSGGARVDLRVCDVRESHAREDERHLRQFVMPINQLNVFLMASPDQQLSAHSPNFRYLRMLEPRVWGAYLKSAVHFGGVRGLVVYYWRSEVSKPICPDNPFRIFLDFNRAASAAWWMQIARVMIGVVAALLLLNLIAGFPLDWHKVSDWEWRRALTLIGVTSLLALITLIGKIRAVAARRFFAFRAWCRARERSILQLTQRA